MKPQDAKIIQSISSLPRIEASEDFTRKVMVRVLEEKLSFTDRVWRYFLWNRGPINQYAGILSTPKTAKECAVCYVLTSTFYLVLGVVLMAGLHFVAADVFVNHGILFLPWLSFFVAIWLLGLAVMMISGGHRAIVMVKTGTILFIGFILGGGALLVSSAWSPAAYMSLAMSLTAVFMGILLYHQLSLLADNKRENADAGMNA